MLFVLCFPNHHRKDDRFVLELKMTRQRWEYYSKCSSPGRAVLFKSQISPRPQQLSHLVIHLQEHPQVCWLERVGLCLNFSRNIGSRNQQSLWISCETLERSRIFILYGCCIDSACLRSDGQISILTKTVPSPMLTSDSMTKAANPVALILRTITVFERDI